jgi:hypothetical protein
MRSFVDYLPGITIVFAAVFLFTTQCSTKTSDDFCTHGYGKTTLQGRVLDFYTRKPIDSVEIRIVWGSSWDHFLDTLVEQNESVSFSFNVPDDCEPYFFTLSNKRYWTDGEHHPAYNVSIEKGAINNFEIHLKPATFFKINVQRDTLDRTSEVVVLQIRKTNTQDWERWGEISVDDFSKVPASDIPAQQYVFSDSGTHRTISALYDLESNANYDVRWVRSNAIHPDTLYYHFTAKPFDTVYLHYVFKKK